MRLPLALLAMTVAATSGPHGYVAVDAAETRRRALPNVPEPRRGEPVDARQLVAMRAKNARRKRRR